MKASRLLSIMMLLQARGRMTAPALANTLEVSTRTVLRDIDQLSAAGVPIWGDRGRAGGFALREGWSTNLTGLTEPEVSALFLAGLPGPATELGLGSAAVSARLKMVASLPTQWREQADRVAGRLHIDPVDWYQAHETPQFLQEAADAVWHNYRIEVQYESWRGVARRELEPLGLVLKAGAWYLIAQAEKKKSALTFRLSNVHAFKTIKRPFKRPPKFDLAQHWHESMTRFEAGLYQLTAHIAVSPRAQKWLANARSKATPIPLSTPAKGLPTGWQMFAMPIESIEHGVRQLLGYGAHAKVMAPEALRVELIKEVQRVQTLYLD
jgi:predicted DNA-binding transcriptional regulator YafY